MQEDGLNCLYNKIAEFGEAKEILQYIDDVQQMIDRNMYDKNKIIEIESKYSIETNFLMTFENSEKIGFDENYKDPAMQVLLNLRDRLYIIAVYKILKGSGQEIPPNIVTSNFHELAKMLVRV